MAFDSKRYSKGEKPHPVFDQASGVHYFNRYFFLRLGVITEVDQDLYKIKVEWIGQPGARPDIPISFPYIGPAGVIGCLPEIGSIGIFGFYEEGGGRMASPLCLAWVPSGLSSGLNQNVVKVVPDSIPTDDPNEIQHRQRKISHGDMIVSAPPGSTLFLNHNVELYDAMQDMLMIREGDQAILMTSLNNYVFADGASVCVGPAVRNGLVLYNPDGSKINGLDVAAMTTSGGKDIIYAVPHGSDIGYDTQYYTEYRVDVDDLGNGKLDLNDINGDTIMTTRNPVVTMALGNFIGNDKRDIGKYGRILRPVLFRSPDDKDGDFNLAVATANAGLDQPAALGLAYSLYFPKSGAFIGMDKEGHYHMNLPRSFANPLGAGRSMSVLAQGSLKEIWGATKDEGNSWDLTAKGGIKWDVGKHANSHRDRSIDISTESSIAIQIGGVDADGLSMVTTTTGKVQETIGGDKESSANNLSITIRGLRTETVQGSATDNIQSDLTVSVQGVSTETVISEKQCKFGKRKTTITNGNDELTVLAGDITETIQTIGNKKTQLTAGNIEESILAGDHKTSIKAGNFKAEVTAGSITIKNSLASMSMDIAGNVKIKGTISVVVDAPIVKVGSGAPLGGAITGLPGTSPSHYDFITGAPHRGSVKVGIA